MLTGPSRPWCPGPSLVLEPRDQRPALRLAPALAAGPRPTRRGPPRRPEGDARVVRGAPAHTFARAWRMKLLLALGLDRIVPVVARVEQVLQSRAAGSWVSTSRARPRSGNTLTSGSSDRRSATTNRRCRPRDHIVELPASITGTRLPPAPDRRGRECRAVLFEHSGGFLACTRKYTGCR